MSQSEISIHLILANISEKRELIRKIVQGIDYRFRPYIKCNGSSRCLASIRVLSPTGSWAVEQYCYCLGAFIPRVQDRHFAVGLFSNYKVTAAIILNDIWKKIRIVKKWMILNASLKIHACSFITMQLQNNGKVNF